jgi:hypothetical protein
VECDQVVNPTLEVRPAIEMVNQPPNAVMIGVTGAGVSEQIERQRSSVISPDEADDIARKLAGTADMVRRGRAEFAGGHGGS